MECVVCGDSINGEKVHCELDVTAVNLEIEDFKAHFCQECAAQAALGCPFGPLEYEDWINPDSQIQTEQVRAHQD